MATAQTMVRVYERLSLLCHIDNHLHTRHFYTQYCDIAKKETLQFLTLLSKRFIFVNQGKL